MSYSYKNLKKESKERISETFNVAPSPASPTPPVPKSRAPTSNDFQTDRKTLLRTAEHVTLANQAVALTNDVKSRKRYEQLAAIVCDAGAEELWEVAYKATEARLRKSTEPLDAPGAYFCSVLASLLRDADVYVPRGTPQERQEIRQAIRDSLQQADNAPGGKRPTNKTPPE